MQLKLNADKTLIKLSESLIQENDSLGQIILFVPNKLIIDINSTLVVLRLRSTKNNEIFYIQMKYDCEYKNTYKYNGIINTNITTNNDTYELQVIYADTENYILYHSDTTIEKVVNLNKNTNINIKCGNTFDALLYDITDKYNKIVQLTKLNIELYEKNNK